VGHEVGDRAQAPLVRCARYPFLERVDHVDVVDHLEGRLQPVQSLAA
jgi:hypothetical protein